MCSKEINILNFLEQLQCSALRIHNLKYIPISMDSNSIYSIGSPAVISSIISIANDISVKYSFHVEEVISIINLNGKCEDYINLICHYLFEREAFCWNNFRIFVALICEISTVSFRKGMTFLADDFIVTTSTYIQHNLQHHINGLHGWRTFEQDSVKTVLKIQQSKMLVKEKLLKRMMKSQQSSVRYPNQMCLTQHSYNESFSNHEMSRSYTTCPQANVLELDIMSEKSILNSIESELLPDTEIKQRN